MDGAKFMRANLTVEEPGNRAAGWHRGAFDRSAGFDVALFDVIRARLSEPDNFSAS